MSPSLSSSSALDDTLRTNSPATARSPEHAHAILTLELKNDPGHVHVLGGDGDGVGAEPFIGIVEDGKGSRVHVAELR